MRKVKKKISFSFSIWKTLQFFQLFVFINLFSLDQSSNISEMFASGSASNVTENVPNEEESSDDELLFRPSRGGRGART